jgi:hypothetical protein
LRQPKLLGLISPQRLNKASVVDGFFLVGNFLTGQMY